MNDTVPFLQTPSAILATELRSILRRGCNVGAVINAAPTSHQLQTAQSTGTSIQIENGIKIRIYGKVSNEFVERVSRVLDTMATTFKDFAEDIPGVPQTISIALSYEAWILATGIDETTANVQTVNALRSVPSLYSRATDEVVLFECYRDNLTGRIEKFTDRFSVRGTLLQKLAMACTVLSSETLEEEHDYMDIFQSEVQLLSNSAVLTRELHGYMHDSGSKLWTEIWAMKHNGGRGADTAWRDQLVRKYFPRTLAYVMHNSL